MEKRYLNINFNKAGSGSTSTRTVLPPDWMKKMDVTQENRQLIAEFDGEEIRIRKVNIMDTLEQRIDNTIDKEAMKTGKMGTEAVTATLTLTEEEKAVFREMDKYDSKHYFWEIEGNELHISYTEDVS